MQIQRLNDLIQRTTVAGAVILLAVILPGACTPRSGFVTGPAGKVFYDRGPTGVPARVSDVSNTPVVLLHGFAGNSEHWAANLALLRQDRRAIAIDLRGHGRSDAKGPYSIPDLADDVVAVVDALELDRFVLVGHSMGGLIALECAHRLGDRVAGVFLLDSGGAALLYPEPMKARILDNVARDAHAESIEAFWETMLGDASPALRARLFADLKDLPRAAILGLMQSMFIYDPRPALAGYRGPLRALITTQNDGSTALHHLRTDIPVERLSSANHWRHLDHPEQFHDRLQAFLNLVDRKASRL